MQAVVFIMCIPALHPSPQTSGPGVYDLPLHQKPVMLISHALGEGKKSLAYHVTLQSANKTLTDKDAQKFLGRLERVLEQRGASLRK